MAGPNVIVEMNADEKRVWAAIERLKKKEEEYQATIKKTGQVSKTTGSEVEKAMLRAGEAAVTGMAGYLKELKAVKGFGPKVAAEIEKAWIDSGKAGVRSMKDVLASIGEVDASFAEVGHKAIASLEAADKAAKFSQTKQELNSLGGEFSVMAKNIEANLAGSFEESVVKANELVAKMKELDPSAAERIEAGIRNARKEIEDAKFETLQKQLAQSGDEGRELADVIGKDLKQATLDAEGGMQGILDKIVQMRPETEASVQKYKEASAEAAKFSEGKYAEVLETLRKGDPIAKQVAATLKRELVDAGEIVERSFEEMIAPLDKIDPKAAEAARRLKSEAEDAANKSESVFDKFGKSAVAKITAIAGAYIGVQEAIQATNRLLREQEDILKDAAEQQMDLAGAQQEAIKNLAGFSIPQQRDLLNTFVPDVAAKTGFSDLKQLTLATGAAGSAGGSFRQIQSAVEESAKLTRLTPEAVDEYASAAIDLSRGTSVDDARTNLGLLVSAGTQSRVVDPEKLARNLPPAVVAGTGTVPQQNKVDASREAASVFGVLSKASTDVTGEMSANATIQLLSRMQEFFGDLPGEIQKAQDKLANLEQGELSSVQEERLSQLQAKKVAFTPEVAAELDELRKQDADGGRLHRTERARLSELTAMEFSPMDAARMKDLETKKTQNREEFEAERKRLQAQLQQAKRVKDPGTIFGRFQALQQNEALRGEFFSEKFGEQRFRGAFQDLTDRRSPLTQMLFQTKGKIQASPQIFERTVSELGEATPALKLRGSAEAFEARKAARQVGDTEGALLARQRKEVSDVLARNRSERTMTAVAEGMTEDLFIDREVSPDPPRRKKRSA